MLHQHYLYTFLIQCVWPGLGLLGESYLLFSLGTLQPLLAMVGVVPMVMPLVLGVIIGMIGFGVAGSLRFFGRRWGSIGTASLMWMGSVGMVGTSFLVHPSSISSSSSSSSVVLTNAIFSTSLCVLGLGVGGEYPMAAASAAEQHLADPSFDDNHVDSLTSSSSTTVQHRGRHVQLVFSMQGMGILLHCSLLWGLLMLFGDDQTASLLLVWRILYAVGVVLLSTVLMTRILLLKESPVWQEDQKRAAEMVALEHGKSTKQPQHDNKNTPKSTSHPAAAATAMIMKGPYPMVSTVSSLSVPSFAVAQEGAVYHMHIEQVSTGDKKNHYQWRLAWKLYGARLLGVSLSWFVWDIAFYGNKLFQSAFLLALTGNQTTLTAGAGAATLNAAVAAAGYLTAAAIMDRIGHWRLQLIGFGVTGLLFLMTGLFLDRMDKAKAGLVVLYLATSYFGQVGPNATTFAVPTKVIPTAWRTMGHGIAAASGKLGALMATLMFHNSNNNNGNTANLFLWSGYASLLGAVVTYWLVPFDNNDMAPSPLDGKIQQQNGDHDYSLDANWHKAASGRPFVVPADSFYERLLAKRRKADADGNYLTSDLHDAVYD